MSAPTQAASPDGLPPLPPNIQQIASPFLFGILFNWALFGILSVQVFIYARSFKSDPRWMKALVYFVYLFETAQTAMTGADMYYWYSAGFGNILHLANPYISPIDTPFFIAVISLAVQLFYSYRIYKIRRPWWALAVFIGLVALMQSGAGMYNGINAALFSQFSVRQEQGEHISSGIWLIGAAINDVIIAITITYLLLSERNKEAGIFSSDLLTKIVRLTLETNMLTASIALISVALAYALPTKLYFTAVTAVMGKLYSNTLLVTLNNRLALRGDNAVHHDIRPSVMLGSSLSSGPLSSGNRTAVGELSSFEAAQTNSIELSKFGPLGA